jgi:hypothetical protein
MWEDNCENDIGEANIVLKQEQEVQQWMTAGQLDTNSDVNTRKTA